MLWIKLINIVEKEKTMKAFLKTEELQQEKKWRR